MINNNILNNPKSYTLTAIIIGYLMIGDYSPLEQNAIGTWLMAIGQILETNSAIELALKEKDKNILNNNIFTNNDISNEDLDKLSNILNNMLDKLNTIKKSS